MRVQFWGTRGSIPKPGTNTARYGGNTACTEVRSARGTLVILDCGTGGHALGLKLMASGAKNLRGHILISHTHWDHIQGIPFFAPLFVAGHEWHIYGPKGLDHSLRETLAGQMQHTYFPLTPEAFGAKVHYHDLVEGAFELDDIKVSTHFLNHPALTLGYRLEADGATVVHCCDHEPHSRNLAGGQGEVTGQDLRYAEFLHGADLLIHDGQYTAAEYPDKIGWGHSPVEYAVKLAQFAQVKRLALTHHDPVRDDEALDRVLEGVKNKLRETASPLEVLTAAEGLVLEVQPSAPATTEKRTRSFQAETSLAPALAEVSVTLAMGDPSVAATLSDAVRAEGIAIKIFSDMDEAQRFILQERPSLVILEHDRPRLDGLKACRAIRQSKGEQLPVVVIAAQEDPAGGAAAGVTDWLIKPFTSSYARSKIRMWVLRAACRWIRATLPPDEERRLASLRSLNLLDTAAEEKFDRITRLASALFNVPIAYISLVDENRQWFKSCLGLSAKETSRDVSFCSHVIYNREPMIVPDTFLDARFADNPLVTSDPRIRFYAGYPLILDDGSCIGTLCLVDRRPHAPEADDLARLGDLAEIVLQEFRRLEPSKPARSQGSPQINTDKHR